ncbi:hypothetical protein B0H12DRAFT_1244123 [Mycena haematopus]|nr:hypothetical protein B0H12DRAFT_1244123 [Mycena haematopus]
MDDQSSECSPAALAGTQRPDFQIKKCYRHANPAHTETCKNLYYHSFDVACRLGKTDGEGVEDFWGRAKPTPLAASTKDTNPKQMEADAQRETLDLERAVESES